MQRKIKINNMWGEKIPEELLKKAVCLVLDEEKVKKKMEVGLVFVSSELMREINLKFTGRDSLTDVLSFPLQDGVGPAKDFLGEVIICPEVALFQARERGHPLEDELLLLAIHGVLHLLGYKDEEDEDRRLMEEKEKNILRLLGKNEDIV